MKKPLYKNERTLFIIALIISLLCWLGLMVASRGIILAFFPAFFIAYLFAQSGFISYLKGTGAMVSDKQFPDIQDRVKECARKVGLDVVPRVYVLQANGLLNAFATRFLRKNYIILLSDILDSLEDDPEAINFYIGHEMGHIDRKHLIHEPVLCFGLILPLIGSGYSRAREYTCDLYGAACCSPEAAQKGLALLAVGAKRYKTINVKEYLEQLYDTSGFWMSFHELISSYPWLVKRFASISPGSQTRRIPHRNPLAYIFAVFVPRLNVMSLVIIYMIIIVISAGESFRHYSDPDYIDSPIFSDSVEDYSQQTYNDYEYENEDNTYAENTATLTEEQFYSMPVANKLKLIAEEVNKSTPMKIDEVTTLQRVHEENGNFLVYNYKVSVDASSLDYSQLKESLHSSSFSHWCYSEDTEIFRDNNVNIIYRYKDTKGGSMKDIVFKTSECGR